MRSEQLNINKLTGGRIPRWYGIGAATILLVAICSNGVFLNAQGPTRAVESDAVFYLALADQLARDGSYANPRSLWPGSLEMERAPGWPFVASVVIKLFPIENRAFLIRATAAAFNVVNSLIIAGLTLVVFNAPRAALLAGIGYALFPTALYLTDLAEPEILFVTLVGVGSIAWCWGGGGHRYWGALFLGLACLVRQNFILLPVALIAVASIMSVFYDLPWRKRALWLCVTTVPLFFFPVMTWILRNYTVSYSFPIVSTIRGETFYGANNQLVAEQLQRWGYWVFPDTIPGERKKAELAQSMSAVELDRYYWDKGLDYLRQNRSAMPRLLLGKLIRAYVPIPWRPHIGSYLAYAYRGVLYLFFALSLFTYGRRWLWQPYGLLVLAMIGLNVVTVLVFYGSSRFAFAMEPFFIPCAALWITEQGYRKLANRDPQV